MSRRKTVKVAAIIIGAALLLLINTPPLSRRMPGNINVILLTVDSLRPDHLGCYGYGKSTSPNIDAIAEKGQLFRRAYCQSAWTIPGVMSVLTSLQPPVHGIEQRGDMLDPRVTTIFDCFRDAGYETPNICFLLTIPEFSGIRIGPIEERYFSEKDDEELFRWLDENHDTKFFLWYHHRNVHLPYNPPEGSSKISPTKLKDEGLLSPGVEAVLSESAVVPVGTVEFEQPDIPIIKDLYDGEIRDLDKFVGRLYARLQKYDLLGRTLIVITADHGEELFDHGFVGHASTMHSATLYDEVIRIPLIMSLADYVPGAVEVREQVQQIDIMPTILDLLKIPLPPGVQGRSLVPVFFDIRQQNETSVPVFAETVYGGFHATEEMAKTRLRCVRTDAWKLIETDGPEGKAYELFDLLLDPNELQNVYGENPQVASLLQALLGEWERENGIRRKAIAAGATSSASKAGEGACPQVIFPYDGAVLRFAETGGSIRASWTGSPASTYIVEYEIGTGVHRLTGSFFTFGNRRNFGPYSREIWKPLAVRNPWRFRVSPDTQPRCWSEWIQFTFE